MMQKDELDANEVSRRAVPLKRAMQSKVPGIALSDVVSTIEDAGVVSAGGAALEFAVIQAIACQDGAEMIFEFGPDANSAAVELETHDGRQTLVTDLTPSGTVRSAKSESEILQTLKPEAVTRSEAIRHVDLLHGRAARLMFAPWLGACDLVIFDAAKDYDYVMCDTLTALHLARPGGTVLWRYYETAAGVTQCLNELVQTDPRLTTLRHIAGTSLCLWRKPVASRLQD